MNEAGVESGSAGGRRVKLAVMILAALIAAWFSLRHALLGMLEREYPLLGLALAPSSATSAGIIALNRVARDGVADAETRRLLKQAARSPLLAEPFIAAGLDASARDQSDEALRLFELARARDPRSIVVRYWLFDHYLRSGHFVQGIDEAQPLLRLQPAVTPQVTSFLTALLDVPQARPILLNRLRTDTPWKSEFLRQVAVTPRLRAEIGPMLQTTGAESAVTLRDQEGVIVTLLRAGDVEGAWKSWLSTLPVAMRSRAVRGRIYDADFAGWPGVAPFNWRIAGAAATSGAAPDIGEGTMLRIAVTPAKELTLAEQTILANAGRYRLSFAARAPDEEPSAALLEVQVRCAGTRKPLGKQQARELSESARVVTLEFDVPQKCPAIQVRFVARPGEDAGGLSALVFSVKLEPAM